MPYLVAPDDKVARWTARQDAEGWPARPRIGFVFSGNPGHKNDRNRSIALERLLPLLRTPGLDFVCLQKEFRPGDREALRALPQVRDVSDALGDFTDTAALIATLDLVVSIDTSVAHLAGALGKPVWILLPWLPDFRWLLDREDSPWYPTAHLFRQPVQGDWDSVVARVAGELARRFAV